MPPVQNSFQMRSICRSVLAMDRGGNLWLAFQVPPPGDGLCVPHRQERVHHLDRCDSPDACATAVNLLLNALLLGRGRGCGCGGPGRFLLAFYRGGLAEVDGVSFEHLALFEVGAGDVGVQFDVVELRRLFGGGVEYLGFSGDEEGALAAGFLERECLLGLVHGINDAGIGQGLFSLGRSFSSNGSGCSGGRGGGFFRMGGGRQGGDEGGEGEEEFGRLHVDLVYWFSVVGL